MPAQSWLKVAAFPRCSNVLRYWTLAASLAVAAIPADTAAAFHNERHVVGGPQAFAPLADVIAFVERRGWSVDLAYLCKGLSLTEPADECRFRQVAVHAKIKTLDDHGFNIPTFESPPLHVVIYHAGPLAGEFFLASTDGTLIRAVFRARGTDFKAMSDERASTAFKNELAFWQSNFAGIERAVSNGKSNSVPFPEQRP